MNFFSIFDGLATVSRFEKAVDRMFKRVASDRPRVLIIDIRENGGGEDSVAQALLRHLTEKRFRLTTSDQLKRSKEARDFISSMIRIPFRWLRLHKTFGLRRSSARRPGDSRTPLLTHYRATAG